jgi:urease accessory protein
VIVRSPPARGVRGTAQLAFTRRGSRTVLSRSRLEAPMAMVRPFELPGGAVLVQLLSLGPGLCGGDSLAIDVHAGPGAHAIVTTTAATRVMSMDEDAHAEQHVTLQAAEAAVLEYYPCITLPYPASALMQAVAADAAGGARIGILECWAMGRVARGEHLEFRSLRSRTTVSRSGVLAYADALLFEPGETDLTNAGILAGRRYLASGVWAGVEAWPENDPDPVVRHTDPLLVIAPSAPGLVYLRALAHDGPALDAALQRSLVRVAEGWRLPAVCLDRFHC